MANENNIPNEINLPGSLTGRHESSLIAPMGFSSFSTNMKSDIAPIGFAAFTTNFKSDVFPIPFVNFNTAMKSDIPTLSSVPFTTRLQSDISPMGSILGANNLSSNTAPLNSTLGANNIDSSTAPLNSTLGANNTNSTTAPLISQLGANNTDSATAPLISVLGANNTDSATAPINSTLTGRFDTSDISPIVSQLQGRHDASDTAPVISTLTGRFESSDTAPAISVLTGRFESSDTAPVISTLTGRFESSDTAPLTSVLTGRHETSGIDDAVTQLSGRFDSSDIAPVISTLTGRFDSSDTAPIISTLTGRHDASDVAPVISTLTGRFESSPIDTTIGVNFVDIPNLDTQGFTTLFDTGTPTQFKGATAGDYTYPDSHGLGFGLIGNSLFTNPYPTPYTTPLFPDGFVQNQPIEESQFSIESFAGGGKIGLGTEGFKHSTFGGVQGQVPIMGNNPTGLGEFTSGGNTSGDIGIVNAFDDTKSGAKGFTPQMFDLGLPKTQFNGVAGTPGSLTYEYPTDVGPAGIGRLMYDVPFADAGNPYGGLYISSLAEQIPTNPQITINKLAGTDPVQYNLYNASPNRLHFNEGNKYENSLSNFEADIEINGSHPKSILANFASREHSPSPLDSMQVLIPGNTGPTGEEGVTANYTHVDGYPNYNTQNLSYSSAGVANQRQGFVRNELFARTIDYDTDGTYGHDLKFGGTGDDPKGLKSYKKPHILRDIGKKWNGFSNEGTPFDEGAFRGGFLTLGNRALLDVVRNTKHIISDPIKGLLWGLKQIGLQASNPKVETEMAFLGRRTRVFNLGIGLLANMLTGPFGIKLYRHGLLNGIGEDKSTYETAVKAHGGINPYDADRAEFGPATVGKGGANRLALLKDELHFGSSGLGAGGFLGLGNLLGFTGQKIDLLSDTAFAGPKSLYGIGGTTIRRYYNAGEHLTGEPLDSNQDEGQGGRSSLIAKYSTINHYGLALASDNREGFEGIATDFREDIYNELGGTSTADENMNSLGDSYTFPYTEFSRDAKFGYTPYASDRNRNKLPADGEEQEFALDHGLDEYIDFDQDYGDVQTDEIDGQRDMIKLMVEDIPASVGGTKKIVRFRSYLSEISDTITPEWEKVSYVGRPDQVHSYSGASREVSFTLKFASLSRNGMIPMYKKINYLYGLAYPHSKATTPNAAFRETMIAPLIKLTMGDWLYRCPGYFSSIATTVDNDYPWEINLEQEAFRVAQLPQVVSIALGFTVIGDGPHVSSIFAEGAPMAGIHIGGGVSPETADGTFFAELPIE